MRETARHDRRTRTGVFGGSFNPIHCGHIALARSLLDVAGLDEIWFVVSPQNPLKRQADLLPDGLRLDIVRRALAEEPCLEACDCEFRLPKPSYTWNTLQRMSGEWPERSFTLLIGADNWHLFGHWYRAADILRSWPVVVYPRAGSRVDAGSLPAGVTLAPTPLFDISSTEVRRRIRRGESVEGLVPECVREKILECYENYSLGK